MQLCKMMPFLRMKWQLTNNLRESELDQRQIITVGVHQQILKQQKGQPSYKGAIDESNALKGRTIKSSLKKSCVTGPTALQMLKQKVPHCPQILMER